MMSALILHVQVPLFVSCKPPAYNLVFGLALGCSSLTGSVALGDMLARAQAASFVDSTVEWLDDVKFGDPVRLPKILRSACDDLVVRRGVGI